MATLGYCTLGYCTLGSNRLVEAKAFYDARLSRERSGAWWHRRRPPGERAPKFYMSYFRDLDGNKLCAYCTA